MNNLTRVWVPYESQNATHIDVPEETLNVFDDALGYPNINYWIDVSMSPDNYKGISGLIIVKVWYNREKYERRKDPILEVPIGYWHDHPILKGKWCYYFGLGDVHRFLQRALIDLEQREREGEGESEEESANEMDES